MVWKTQRFGDVCKFVRGPFGGSLKKNIFKEEGYAVYEQKHAIYDQFTDIRYFVDEEKFDEMIRFELFSGDLIMSCSGTMGKIAIVPPSIPRGIINQALLKLTPNKALSSEFLKLWMESRNFQEQIEQLSQGAAIKNMASVKILKEIKVPTPSESEQKRIVALLDTVFADLEQTRAKTEQNLKNARELFDSYLQQVFSQKGEGWVETALGNVAKFKNGLNFSQSSKGEKLKVVGVRDFKSNFMVPLEQLETIQIDGDLSEEYELKKNDIITVRSNGNKRLIGRCLLMGNPVNKTSYSGFTIRIRLLDDNISPEFLTYYMKSSSTHELLINAGEGANISNLNQKILTALPVTYPSYEHQCELVKNIKRIETESNSLKRIYTEKLNSIDELKKSILQKAFNGELTATAD